MSNVIYSLKDPTTSFVTYGNIFKLIIEFIIAVYSSVRHDSTFNLAYCNVTIPYFHHKKIIDKV